MICRPEKTDIPQMKEIWKLCFGDSIQDINYFYDVCFSFDDCYIAKEGDTVQAVIQLIKCQIICGEKKYDARYLYAVCTHPDFQGKGVMSCLINTALGYEKESGTKAVLCIPSSESLFGFYKRFGFENAAFCSQKQLSRQELNSFSAECSYCLNGDVKAFNGKRNEILSDIDNLCFVSFPNKFILLSKGFGYSFLYTENSYASFSIDGDSVSIFDCGFSNEKGFGELCFALKNETDAEKYSFDFTNGVSDSVLKGVINILDNTVSLKKHIYLGFKLE